MAAGLNMQTGIATLADAATAELRERILSGELESGAPLRLEELARSLGTSISPIREAVRKLETLGLAVHVAHRGSRVKELDVDDLRDTYEARLALEPMAVARASGRISPDGGRARTGRAAELHALPRARRPARSPRGARRVPLHAVRRLRLGVARAPDPPRLGEQRALPRARDPEPRDDPRPPGGARAHPRDLRRGRGRVGRRCAARAPAAHRGARHRAAPRRRPPYLR